MTQPQEIKKGISFGAAGIPKFHCPSGIRTNPDECGQDSFCIADTEKRLVLGIADGVSGSGDSGGNPAVLARSLMKYSAQIAEEATKTFKPRKVIKKVFKIIVNEGDEQLANGASSTICLISISKKTGKLKYANLGDSGFLILSPNETGRYKVRFRSEYQLYEFNFPHQLCLYSDGEGDFEDLKNIGTNTQKLILKTDEVVLLMTDGVFDNLFDEELERFTNYIMKSTRSAQELVEIIIRNAKLRSFDGKASTPFAVESRKFGQYFTGGKVDDITAAAAIMN